MSLSSTFFFHIYNNKFQLIQSHLVDFILLMRIVRDLIELKVDRFEVRVEYV